MKKFYFSVWVMAGLSMFPGTLFSQAGYTIPTLKELKDRKLVVLLQEEDPKIIKGLTKKPDKLSKYKSKIKSINQKFTAAVKEVWKLNSEVEFIPWSQYEKFKNKQYAFLFIQQLSISSTIYPDDRFPQWSHNFWVIGYTRADIFKLKPNYFYIDRWQFEDQDYAMFLPTPRCNGNEGSGTFSSIIKDKDSYYTKSDLIFALLFGQQHINYMIETNHSVIRKDFIFNECEKNRDKIKGKVLYLDIANEIGFLVDQSKIAYPYEAKKIKKTYRDNYEKVENKYSFSLQLVSSDTIETFFDSPNDDQTMQIMWYPYDYGPIGNSNVRIVVNKKGIIFNHGKTRSFTGDLDDDLKVFEECNK